MQSPPQRYCVSRYALSQRGPSQAEAQEFARRWVDDLCYQLTFFCERLQQVKGLSQAHLMTASPPTALCSNTTLLLL